MSLSHEIPVWKEHRQVRGAPLAATFGLSALVAVAGIVSAFLVYGSYRIHGASPVFMLFIATGLTLGFLGIAATLSARSVICIFADRLEIQVGMFGFGIWKRIVRWPEVARCDVCKNWQPVLDDAPQIVVPSVKKFHALARTIGSTSVMFGGDGIRLQVGHNQEGILVGSDNPQRLCDLIEQMKNENNNGSRQ